MNKTAQKIKAIIKGPAPKSSYGTDPKDPWSAAMGINESSLLNKYLESKGINPAYVSKDQKISHSKSQAFLNWIRNQNEEYQFEDQGHLATKGEGGKTRERLNDLHKSASAYKEIKTPRGPGSHNEEKLDELSPETKASYKDKATQQAKELKQHTKGEYGGIATRMLARREKGLKRVSEDVGDPKAAVNADGLNTQMDTMQSEKMSKAAKMIKDIYKKKRLKEDLYDTEKEDKSIKTYGKKPNHDKGDKKDSEGENKPTAAAVLKGGTTLTGETRDTIELDPMMRNRPNQPDVTKKDKKEEKPKDKDGKKEKEK